MTDMRPKSLLIAGLLLFTVAWQGEANGQEDMLKGLREFHIVVEDLNDHAKKCGVTKDSLETSVRFVLQQSKVKLKPSDPLLPYVYVVAYVLEGGGLCSAYFGLSIEAYTRVVSTGQTGTSSVWRESRSARGPANTFDRMARDSFEFLSKTLVADWSKVNQ